MPASMYSQLISILFSIPCVLIAITFHEFAHGYVANKLGDPTAESLGRLTLNPLKHLDPIGAICFLLFRFGWAKPVPVNVRYFKKPRRDMALVAISGPITNILLAFIGMIFYRISYALLSTTSITGFGITVSSMLLSFLNYFYILNTSFAVFNLIPIPPLDGSRLLSLFLPPNLYFKILRYERYITIIILILLYIGVLNIPLNFAVNLLLNGMSGLLNLIPFL